MTDICQRIAASRLCQRPVLAAVALDMAAMEGGYGRPAMKDFAHH